MDATVFLISATIILTGAGGVLVARNPVHAALFLVQTLFGVAVLFVLQDATFLAAVQVIVYAGAVVILFLFVIMLLDLREAARRKLNLISLTMGIIAVGALFLVYKSSLESTYGEVPQQHEVAANTAQAEVNPTKLVGSTRALGQALFSKDNGFILPFEMVSILLLVAMVGVILLSRKEPR